MKLSNAHKSHFKSIMRSKPHHCLKCVLQSLNITPPQAAALPETSTWPKNYLFGLLRLRGALQPRNGTKTDSEIPETVNYSTLNESISRMGNNSKAFFTLKPDFSL